MIIKKIILVLNHYRRFGFNGVKFLFTTLYGREKLLRLDFPEFSYPIYLRNKTSDIPTFYQCIFNEDYNINYDLDPKVIVDLGANIGLSAVFFKTKFPKAKIICVEPAEVNYNLAIKNTRNFENIHCLLGGVWHRNALLKIEDAIGSHWGFRVTESTDNEGIKAMTIDHIMDQMEIDKIDILKIDVEGSERYIFDRNVDIWLPKVNVIVIEFHDRYIPGCSKAFFKALEKYDFAITRKGESIVCYMHRLDKPAKVKDNVF